MTVDAARGTAGPAGGEAVLADAVAAYQAALGTRLAAAYALGSLAHGGFSPLVSDVDLGLIMEDPARISDRLTVRTVARGVRAGGSALHERLSVFWATPSALRGQARGGRFPPLDRLDLLEHGRLLTGRDARAGLARPGQTELLVAGAEFALRYLGGAPTLQERAVAWARPRPGNDGALADIRDPARLAARGPRRITKVVLFPVRFLFTAQTGRVGTNAAAAEWYLASPGVPGTGLVRAALAWRQKAPSTEVAAELLEKELVRLYLHYLGDHIVRLEAAGQHRLAGRFRRTRAGLEPGE